MRTLRRWIVSPTLCVVVLLCVATAGVSIYLKLQLPETYLQWRSDPLTVTYKGGIEAKDKIIEAIKSL